MVAYKTKLRSLSKRSCNVALFSFNIVNGLAAIMSIFVCGITLAALQNEDGSVMGFYTDGLNTINQLFEMTSLFKNFGITDGTVVLLLVSMLILVTSLVGLGLLIRPQRRIAIAQICLVALNAILLLSLAYSGLVVNHHIQSNLRQKLVSLQNRIDIDLDGDTNYPGDLFTDIQSTWHCCGVSSASEWITDVGWFRAKYANFARLVTDNSVVFPGCTWYESSDCAVQDYRGEVLPFPTSDCVRAPVYSIYQRGCSDTMKNEISRCLNIFIGATFGFAFLQALGLAASCSFLRKLRQEKSSGNGGPAKTYQPFFVINNNSSNAGFDNNNDDLPAMTPPHRVDVTSPEGQAELAAICAAVIKSNAKF